MITIIQTPANGTQFTGVAGAGLITFTDLGLPPDQDVLPIIHSICLENRGVETLTTIECFLMFPGDTVASSTRVQTIRRLAAESGFSLVGCAIPVPRVVDGLANIVPWSLILTTTGKTAAASFVVSFDKGRAGGC